MLTTKQLRNRETSKVAILYGRHSYTIPSHFVRHYIPLEVNFHLLIGLKCAEKSDNEICFLCFYENNMKI